MPLEAGKLDRLITIQEPIKTRGSAGGEITTWSLFAKVWAEKVPQRTGERLNAAAIRASRLEMFRIRYLEGCSEGMRIVYQNQVYRILGVDEYERLVSMEIIAEFLEGNGGS